MVLVAGLVDLNVPDSIGPILPGYIRLRNEKKAHLKLLPEPVLRWNKRSSGSRARRASN